MRGQQHIYFLAPVGGGPIKIGCSQTPMSRLITLQSWAPYRLELLASAPGNPQEESAVHAEFAQFWSHSEWFRACPEIYAVICEVRATGQLPARFRGVTGAKRVRPQAKRTPEQIERMRASSNARWNAIRAARAAKPIVEAFLKRTGMSEDCLGKKTGVAWALGSLLREQQYGGEAAPKVLEFIRQHEAAEQSDACPVHAKAAG